MKTVRKHIIESRKDISDRFYIVPPVICKDGFKMSVQHSSWHYCSPHIDFAERQGYAEGSEFESYEVGYPSEMEEILLPYAENPECPTGTVYACVPAQIVEQVAEMHGGLVSMDKKTNLDVFVERQRDWLVDILANMQICDFCVHLGDCDGFVDKETCFEGNRKWLLEPYDEDRWHSLR